MHWIKTLLALLVAPVVSQEGAWSINVKMTNSLVTKYFDVISASSSYLNATSDKICTTTIATVDTQLVSGTNYRYHVSGCAINTVPAANRTCSCANKTVRAYAVSIYEPWINTRFITGVEVEQSASVPGRTSYGHVVTSSAMAYYYKALNTARWRGTTNFPTLCANRFTSLDIIAGGLYTLHIQTCAVESHAKTGPGCKCNGAPLTNYAVTPCRASCGFYNVAMDE
ncbi:hypothetical protein SPRG_04117 [Saprolegnia parasitica CBS 223.65]|uniref:Cystatin domain-containing protein n=1 Tax=Saprolegnia parasitica (strain CBS 223.65) TaxID=695850 RepID=A0A067CLV0_SAPPC|nr:hypothetical protein SPRG_04117 [Saprolegnia parasitica CBS 223.65]KDO31503.1 hypothetical protein SPRG_04117 [Saprolegnia parasitica CBS 223.65]|eukprot:XP_012198090.1 hypothetical protein SPRG_04117 [Saprolegnia parasitica CBS 223.65]